MTRFVSLRSLNDQSPSLVERGSASDRDEARRTNVGASRRRGGPAVTRFVSLRSLNDQSPSLVERGSTSDRDEARRPNGEDRA